MGSTYPSSLDNFAESSPANLGDSDTTGRTHSERHDDVEAAVEQIEETLGTLPQGSDSTVRDRVAAVESDAASALSAFNTHTHASTPPALSASGGALTGALELPDGSAGAPSLTNTGDTNTGVFFPAADAVGIATGGSERMRIDSAGLITGSGTSLGAWTTYTPTWGATVTNPTLGDGSIVAAYCRIGNVVLVRLSIVFGSTTSAGSGLYSLTLPVNVNYGSSAMNGYGLVYDQSTGSQYPIGATPYGAGAVWLLTDEFPLNYVADSAPVAFASGDQINVNLLYEAT